jgi:hypothetical protein
MNEASLSQLAAVIVGGLVATLGGILTTVTLDSLRRRHESARLAFALKGEIAALLQQIRERGYDDRLTQVMNQIQASGQPFFMPFRLRFRYDRVYDKNVDKIGILKNPLPERIPAFYTRLASIMEDLASLGDGTYAALDLPALLRIYSDLSRLVKLTISEGEQIINTIDQLYGRTTR